MNTNKYLLSSFVTYAASDDTKATAKALLAAKKAANKAKKSDPIMLEHNSDWTDDDETTLMELLGLGEENEAALFVEHDAVEINAEQQALYEAWVDDRNNKAPKAPEPVLTDEQVKAIAADGDKRFTEILALAGKLNADAAFDTHVKESIIAGETKKKGPVLYMLDLERVFGKQLLMFPVPGTKMDAKTNFATDEYQRYELVDGLQKLRKKMFYNDLADNTVEGRAIIAEQNTLGDRFKTTEQAMDKSDEDTKLDGRLATIRTNIKQAVKLFCQLERINNLPMIYSRLADGVREGKYKALPVFVKQKVAETATPIANVFSVNAFLSWKVADAIKAKNGAEFVALKDLEATARQKGEGQGKDAAKKLAKETIAMYHKNMTVGAFVDTITAQDKFLNGDDANDHWVEIQKELRKDTGDDLIMSVFNIVAALKPITDNPVWINRRVAAETKISAAMGDKPKLQTAAEIAAITKVA